MKRYASFQNSITMHMINKCHLKVTGARNYRPCFRENQPKRSFSIKWKRAFWACFRENWVYKFGYGSLTAYEGRSRVKDLLRFWWNCSMRLSGGANLIMQKLMLSCETKCYHVEQMLSWGWNVIILSLCYYVGQNVIFGMNCYHLMQMLSCGGNVIMWKNIFSSGTTCYNLWPNFIIWSRYYHVELMLSCGSLCYHVGRNFITWDQILSCYNMGWNVITWDQMLSSGANVIMWSKRYHVWPNFIIWSFMLSCGANVIM
jgi:hypothetical protein